MSDIFKKVNDKYNEVFGYTPFGERMNDIQNQFFKIKNWNDFLSLKVGVGYMLSSLIQLCNENGWDIEEVINDSLNVIDKRKLQYQSYGRKLRVAIYGGAFNPPTIGHLKVAQYVLNTGVVDEVWMMPSYKHMYNKELEDSQKRLDMCNSFSKLDPRIKVFDFEIKHKLGGETYKLAKMLKEDESLDNFNFYFIIGQDNANTFDNWFNYENLEKLVPFIVVPRKGISVNKNKDWYLKSHHIYLGKDDDTNIPEVSSTLVRTLLNDYYNQSKNDVENYLTKDVLEYIIDNKLYKN